ncbi:putative AC transposase [Pseudolycoriella hygida]|uniref:AC transposase n=1 Tax=Pseudolycoriella hygida TaxID=35572 RepID=A0A9Q0NE90_9DIPT|nr:putative AC transposase [Pseudolycoriella hygida]
MQVTVYCDHRKKYGGMGTLNNHMNRNHKSIFDSEKRIREETVAAEKGHPITSYTPRTITSEIFRHKIVMFMICTDQPFTLVEDEFFRDLINYCSSDNKECKLFCAKTGKSDIESLYHEFKAKMKEILENNDGKISFKVLSITTDNAFNMDTMFTELEKLALQCSVTFDSKNFRVRCFAHIMNLSCQAMIHSVGDGDATKYSSDSEDDDEENVNRARDLPVIAKLRKGVVGIRKSPQRREIFSRQCIAANIKPKIVVRDVRTRWNSTHAMFERAKQLRQPYDLTLASIQKLRKYGLFDEDWEKIDKLIDLLSPFQEATLMLSNEHSPTISRIAGVYQELFNLLEKYVKTDVGDKGFLASKRAKRNDIQRYPAWLVEAAQRGLNKLEKCYPSSDGLVYIVGTVLDPRCKLLWYKATGWPKEWIDHCRKGVTELYKSQYKRIDVESTTTAPSNGQTKHSFKDLFSKQTKQYQKSSADDELKAYLSENVVDPDLLVKEKSGIDGVLGWWKIHQKEYPCLSKMARDFLPAAGTGVPVERFFSSGVDVVSPKQQSMSAQTIQMRICLKAWLKEKNSFKHDVFRAIAHKFGAMTADETEFVS